MKSDSHPLRVMLVSCMPPPSGGIGRWVILLQSWLANRPAVSVRLVPLSASWRPIWDNTFWKRLVCGGLQGIWDGGRIGWALLRHRPQVLHLNTSAELRGPWDTAILALARALGTRCFYHIHMGRLPEVLEHHGWEYWAIRWALKLADRVIVLDKSSEQALKRVIPANRVVRLPNPIAPINALSHNSRAGKPTVLFMGHLVPAKGLQELMQAWHEVQPTGWGLQLAGPGEAAYRERLSRIAGEGSNVEFLGELPAADAWERMQNADAFVLPTHTEGFPYVILEAMAAAKPIICSRVGAIPEMLDADAPEPCGLVIPPRDVSALVGAMRQLLGNRLLRADLGRRARSKLENSYTTDIVFTRLLELWHETAGRTVPNPTAAVDAIEAQYSSTR